MPIPLDPGRGGRSVGPEALQIGDIIVSTTSAAISRAIRAGTGSEVSHAMLYIGGNQVVESVGDGVRLVSTNQALSDATLAVAYRRPGITQMQALQVRDFVGQQIGKPYNYSGIASQGVGIVNRYNPDIVSRNLLRRVSVSAEIAGKGHDQFFCSELIWEAFTVVGVPLDGTPSQRSAPEGVPSLYRRGRLQYVGHLIA